MTMCINRRAFGHGGFLMANPLMPNPLTANPLMAGPEKDRSRRDGTDRQLPKRGNTTNVMSPRMMRLPTDARKDTTRKDGLLDL